MKYFMVFLMTLLFSIATNAEEVLITPDIDVCHTGSYYDPANDGEGINLEVMDDVVVAYFYRPGGDWYTMIGERTSDGNTVLVMYQAVGTNDVREIGDATITMYSENALHFSYRLDYDFSSPNPIPWCLDYSCNGSFIYTRLTQPIPCD